MCGKESLNSANAASPIVSSFPENYIDVSSDRQSTIAYGAMCVTLSVYDIEPSVTVSSRP